LGEVWKEMVEIEEEFVNDVDGIDSIDEDTV